MQFLCLHGAIGNVDNISIQLEPLRKELESDQAATFHFINAPVTVDPPEGFTEYFGPGPHYRWMDDEGAGEESMINRIRRLPSGQNPEDVMRSLATSDKAWRNRETVMQYLYDTLEEHPEVEGIVGYSEGSAMAATLILDEVHRLHKEGRPRRIKCAIFFTGWPPVSPDNELVLSDESEIILDVPTLHIVGANDPYRYGALALYNVCDADTANMFDTGKGHTIPRTGKVISELGDAVRELISSAEE
ncbi:hypothetical protein EYB25_007580 [Talaromyces marneffei]|uniref:DUF341 family oxidoreductase, putative n=2 Tax=Talaromyces marneffei TaxID=37727 RepID=B6QPT9_TALMQ|nr:uncharacterized protein EYB26_005115 [Talaromyces marneffei]EEA20044.1 DUF341 family oxidoreductase, putative [Talaromyces marneffei ATCC 18224]KAE8549065.1 hypothetical protein EYB25_007580 [Talaromyces marneffei]QGA17444.1 hypothetical protein EYB26_005115 [Talaromyces marneffei]